MLGGDLAFLRFPVDGSLEVANLEFVAPGLRIVLDKASWFLREGELAINLFVEGERLYTLAFTLGQAEAGRVTLGRAGACRAPRA